MTKICIDTSVIGGCFDLEFEIWSNKLLDEFISGQKIALISDVTLEELEEAPEKIRKIINKIPDRWKEFVILTDEAKALSDKYIQEKIVSKKYLLDTRHIAIATVNKVDIFSELEF